MTEQSRTPRPGPGRAAEPDRAEPTPDEVPDEVPDEMPDERPDVVPTPVKLTKAARLEARAARLREAEERRARQREQADEDDDRPPARGRGLVISTIALAALSTGLIVVLVVGYFSWQHQRDLVRARVGALKAAKAFALDFGAYDYRSLDADFKKVTAAMTPAFAKDYTATSSKLKPTLVQYKTQVTDSIQGAGVTTAGTSRATVVVFLDQTVRTSQSTVPRLDRNRLQMQLERRDGKWEVAKLLAK